MAGPGPERAPLAQEPPVPLPVALSGGEGSEVSRPMAIVVVGGLLVATLLTLFVIPVLYTLFERERAE